MSDAAPEPKPVCFVVSPIGDPSSEIRRRADQLTKFLINPVLADKYEVIRADYITVPGSINRQVFDHLLKSELVVADLTGHNPNVFYELAVRHAAAKPFIQVIDVKDRIPFDVSDQRTIKFDIHDLDSVEDAKSQLRAHEVAITKPGFKVETPIGEAILQSAAIATGSDETKVVMHALDEVQKRLGQIESFIRPTDSVSAQNLRWYVNRKAHHDTISKAELLKALSTPEMIAAVQAEFGENPTEPVVRQPTLDRKG